MEAESVGLLVTAGLLVRWIGLGDRWDPELLGPTDILRPWDLDAGDAYDMIPTVVRWRVLERVEIAVLGRRFARWAGGHPAVVALLLSRMVRRAREQSFRLVVQKLPLVSSRLHFLLWHFADRFGRMTPDGVLVEMKLPQDMLASMVNSRRQAVSGALAELREQGLIS